MTREEAIHKMEYSKRAYQMLIDEKVQEGVLVGHGINAEWSADTPIIDAYKDMLEACDMAIKALEQKPCKNAIDRDEAIRVASGYCHFSNIPKELAKLPPVTVEPCEVEAAKQAYSKGFEDCRQAVLEQINCWIGSGEYGYTNATYYLTERVKHILSATPEPKYEDIAKAFQLGLALGFGEKHDEMDKMIDEIKKVITPEPKMGRWIEEDMFDGDVAYRCSECNELFWIESGTPKDNEYNFCPKCGCKMQEVKDESKRPCG